MSFRQAKRQARAQLHEHLAFPVWYFPTVPGTAEYRTIRLHKKYDPLGELLRGGFADRQEIIPKAVFSLSEGDVERHGVIITDNEGAYSIDNLLPPDDTTRIVEIVKLPRSFALDQGWDPDAEYMGLGVPTA